MVLVDCKTCRLSTNFRLKLLTLNYRRCISSCQNELSLTQPIWCNTHALCAIKPIPILSHWYLRQVLTQKHRQYYFILSSTELTLMWRLPCLSELTPMILNKGLTHLGSKRSPPYIKRNWTVINCKLAKQLQFTFEKLIKNELIKGKEGRKNYIKS